MNLRQSIFDALQKESTLTNKQLYNLFPKGNRTSIRVYANEVRNKNNSDITPKKTHDHSQTDSSTEPEPYDIIDDPNELLMSISVRELNKPNPNVHWGRILLTLLDKTGRLETKTEQEVMIRRKLVKYSSDQLIELRKRLIKS